MDDLIRGLLIQNNLCSMLDMLNMPHVQPQLKKKSKSFNRIIEMTRKNIAFLVENILLLKLKRNLNLSHRYCSESKSI